MQGADIWTQFIDYEIALNHFGFANLLGYLSVKTPLVDAADLEQK